MLPITGPIGPTPLARPQGDLRDLAQDLEASFLAEMLKHAGLGETPDGFGGGIGEDQFASMLRDLQAKEIAANGGIGLAEAIFKSLEARARD